MRRYMRTADTRTKLENGWKEESRLYEIKAKQGYEPFGWKRAEFAQANCSICVLSMMHPRSRGRIDREEERICRDELYARIVGIVRLFRPRESWCGWRKWRIKIGKWVKLESVGGRRMMMGRICAMSNDIRKRIWRVI